MRNVHLLNAIADHVEAQPRSHYQGAWVVPADDLCDTKACVAGWAVILGAFGGDVKTGEAWLLANDPRRVADHLFETTASIISNRAQELLGLSEHEADVLFWDEWTPVEDLTVPEALRALANGADVEDVTDPQALESVI